MKWLEDGKHPLDWNGPTDRPFVEFGREFGGDPHRSIIDHLESVARRYPHRIAITDSTEGAPATSVSYAQLWQGLSGLAESIAAATQPGELIAIALPACPLLPLTMLACLAAGRPFVALDTHYPSDWVRQVLQDARPTLIIGQETPAEMSAAEPSAGEPPATEPSAADPSAQGPAPAAPIARVINLTRLPQPARAVLRTGQLWLD